VHNQDWTRMTHQSHALLTKSGPNHGVQATAYSVRCAPASRRA